MPRRVLGSRPRPSVEPASSDWCAFGPPVPGTPVTVTTPNGGTWRARCLRVGDTAIDLGPPPHDEPAPDGSNVEVSWKTPYGVLVATGVPEVDGVGAWHVVVSQLERRVRRATPRVPISLRITVTLDDETLDGWTFDLSAGGARVLLPARSGLGAGDEVGLRLALPDGDVVTAGRAVRVNPRLAAADREAQLTAGMAFTGTDPARDDRLGRFVRSQLVGGTLEPAIAR